MLKTQRTKPTTVEEVLERYPRLTGHLICESLGYFTPRSAANAILMHIQEKPFACEWYVTMARGYNDKMLILIGNGTLERTYQNRKYHTGYMANYLQAKALVMQVRKGGPDPVFASWF
jgi:hypothetical protein